ncbi:vomeromodulin-like [Meles meles]|uniref:vomeromodulin-like n=1 Tax=Meles meles TaxID=9662 RepID=UPI001E69FAD1|nr:vomeromodulin-like [Meles meles]
MEAHNSLCFRSEQGVSSPVTPAHLWKLVGPWGGPPRGRFFTHRLHQAVPRVDLVQGPPGLQSEAAARSKHCCSRWTGTWHPYTAFRSAVHPAPPRLEDNRPVKVSVAKMLTLWALVITLTVQAGALDLQTPSLLLGNLPVNQVATEAFGKAPLDLTGRLLSSPQRASPFRKRQARTPGGSCLPVAKYLLSQSNLEEYMNTILPPKIQKKLMCEKVLLSGTIGKVLSMVSNSDILSILDVTSALKLPGGDALGGILGKGSGGILGKGSGGLTSQLPLPSLSKVTDTLNIPGDLGSLLPIGAEKNPAKGLVDTLGVANLPLPLNDVGEQASKLTESTQDMLNNALPAGIGDAVTGLLGTINIEDLLIGLNVQAVSVENMTSTMTGGGILVQATTTAIIGGKGLAGPVVSILGYQVHGEVTLKIGLSTNNTQCVNLQVQEKDIKVNKVSLQIMETYWLVQAKALFSSGIVPVLGGPLPPDPKNANVSLTLSSKFLKVIVTQSAKQSSVKMNNLAASITKIVYSFQSGNQIQATYWVAVEKDGESFATGKTTLILSHDCKILKDKLIADIKIKSSEHSVTPPEAEDEAQDVMPVVLKKFLSALTERSSGSKINPAYLMPENFPE